MLINEFAKRTGLTTHAIRFYEKRGLLSKRFVSREENNYRQYSEEAVERIASIKILCASGFTLAEIAVLMKKWDSGKLGSDEGYALLQRKLEEIDAKIGELKRTKTFLTKSLAVHIREVHGKKKPE